MNTSAVSRLDAYLNRALLQAQTTQELYRVWTTKVRAKRLLAQLDSPEAVAELAARMLAIVSHHTRQPPRRRAERRVA